MTNEEVIDPSNTRLSIDMEEPFWIEEESNKPILLVLTIDRALSLKDFEEDTMYYKFLQILYDNPFLPGDIVIL